VVKKRRIKKRGRRVKRPERLGESPRLRKGPSIFYQIQSRIHTKNKRTKKNKKLFEQRKKKKKKLTEPSPGKFLVHPVDRTRQPRGKTMPVKAQGEKRGR